MGNIDSQDVGYFYDQLAARYPKRPPFSPSEAYPEYPFTDITKEKNLAYAAVREMFHLLGYDQANYGTKRWNPLKDVVKRGDKVVIKPNLVRQTPYKGGSQIALMTHGSIIRAVMDYVCIALKGSGSIILGDAPIQTANWQEIIKNNGLDRITKFYRRTTKIPVVLKDFRTEKVDKTIGSFIYRHEMIGSADDWVVVDLADESQLDAKEVRVELLRAGNYASREMANRHARGKHEYLIHRSILEADVVINLSKMKTHRLGGLTCSMKNLVGILAHKSCLAHYSAGAIGRGGDEYPNDSWVKRTFSWLMQQEDSAKQLLVRILVFIPRLVFHYLARFKPKDKIYEGSWYRNDTMWRMVIDLNRAIVYADKDGRLQSKPQRRYFCLVDGLIAGEKNGPLKPSAKPIGALVAGLNSAAVDFVCKELMGFRTDRVPTVAKAVKPSSHPIITYPYRQIRVRSNTAGKLPNFHFIPASNWIGHIEKA